MYLAAPEKGGSGQYLGPIMTNIIRMQLALADIDEKSVDNLLRNYFESFYDLAAATRREILWDDLVAKYGLPSR